MLALYWFFHENRWFLDSDFLIFHITAQHCFVPSLDHIPKQHNKYNNKNIL